MYETWEEFEANCKICAGCKLAETRNNVVIGRGSKSAKLLFVGEGPGEQEDLQGVPFVGAAGQLLDMLLNACGFSKESYYIANIVKCRPPRNRDPEPNEASSCMPHLRNQFMLLKPKIIVCLGRVAAKTIINPDIRITADRGSWVERKGIKFMATFHPAAVLHDRNDGNLKKQYMFDDMIKVKKFLQEIESFEK